MHNMLVDGSDSCKKLLLSLRDELKHFQINQLPDFNRRLLNGVAVFADVDGDERLNQIVCAVILDVK